MNFAASCTGLRPGYLIRLERSANGIAVQGDARFKRGLFQQLEFQRFVHLIEQRAPAAQDRRVGEQHDLVQKVRVQ